MAAKTAIFSNNVPGGPQNIIDVAKHPDEVFFVNSNTGSDAAGYGNSPGVPVASIDYAISLATANKNTVIYVMPGHAETDDVTIDIAGIHIIGLGKGSDRPSMTYSAVDTTWTISAANVTIENILFVTAIDSVVTFGTISGADFKMINCEWRDTTDIEVITDWTVTGDRPQFINCLKNGYTSGDANVRCISLNGVDGAYIKNCRFITKVTTAVIGFVTAACSNIIIEDCKFLVDSTTDYSKNVVDTITGSTWIVTQGYDIGAGAKFSGGSGGALAGDDVGAVATAVAALQTDLGDASARTNLQSILAMLGNPDVAGATAWSALIGANGTYDSTLGTKVTRSKADVLDSVQNAIFDITGDVEITYIEGLIEDGAVDNEAVNTKLIWNSTTYGDTDICANLDLDSASVGTKLGITGTFTDALQSDANGALKLQSPITLKGGGTIDILTGADGGGDNNATVSFLIFYKKLSSDGAIVASA